MPSLNLTSTAELSKLKHGINSSLIRKASLLHLLCLLLQFDQRGKEMAPQQASSSLADDWLRVD